MPRDGGTAVPAVMGDGRVVSCDGASSVRGGQVHFPAMGRGVRLGIGLPENRPDPGAGAVHAEQFLVLRDFILAG
jgi:hypothetical protein